MATTALGGGAASGPEEGSRPRATRAIRRGTMRLLAELGWTPVAELTLVTGRRLDLLGVSGAGALWAIEIKSSLEDFRADGKWPEYLAWADRFSFAVDPDFPLSLLPPDEGVIVADRFEAVVHREPVLRPLAAARRKAVTLRLARLAAARLHAALDPEIGAELVVALD